VVWLRKWEEALSLGWGTRAYFFEVTNMKQKIDDRVIEGLLMHFNADELKI